MGGICLTAAVLLIPTGAGAAAGQKDLAVSAEAACVMDLQSGVLKLGVIQAEGRGVFRIMFHCLSHPCRKIKILTTAAHSAASDTEKQKRRSKGADSAPLERLCSGTYNYTER